MHNSNVYLRLNQHAFCCAVAVFFLSSIAICKVFAAGDNMPSLADTELALYPRIQVLTNSPDGDALEAANTNDDAPSGHIVYFDGLLMLRKIGKGAKQSDVTTFRIKPKGADVVFEPQFSPDGSYVLVKVGWPWDQPGLFKVFILNWQTTKFQGVLPNEVSSRTISWSPDSKKIAYIVGETKSAIEELYIYDVSQSKSYKVTQGPFASKFAWTSQGNLLFTAIDTTDLKYSKQNKLSPPNIYEYSFIDKTIKELVTNATNPNPSSDGQWLSYISYPPVPDGDLKNQLKSNNAEALQPHLALFNLRTKKNVDLPLSTRVTLVWMPNSSQFVTALVKGDQDKNELQVSIMNILDREIKQITILSAKNDGIPRPDYAPQFDIHSISRDGKYLFVIVREFPEQGKDGIGTLQAINLQNGTTNTLSRTKGDMGIDWVETSN